MRPTGNPTGVLGVVATADAPDGWAGVADLSALFVQRINCMHGIVKRLCICPKPPEYD